MVGNYTAIRSTADRAVYERLRDFLETLGYVGFANFDMKVDPRDGSYRLFELNPRQGRSSFFVTLAGYNLARFLVEDRVFDRRAEPVYGDNEVLWLQIPSCVLFRYTESAAEKARARQLIRAGRSGTTLGYQADNGTPAPHDAADDGSPLRAQLLPAGAGRAPTERARDRRRRGHGPRRDDPVPVDGRRDDRRRQRPGPRRPRLPDAPSIPDRTAYILGRSTANPVPLIQADLEPLASRGATAVAIPCNTAHYFFDELQAACPIPILNMLNLAAAGVRRAFPDASRVAVLGTRGTVQTGVYRPACEAVGLSLVPIGEDVQRLADTVIFDRVKAGIDVEERLYLDLLEGGLRAGADAVLLACTELSVPERRIAHALPAVDAMACLAEATVLAAGKPLRPARRPSVP